LLFASRTGIRKTEAYVNFEAKRRKRELSQGREHLVKLERSEQLYLVTPDRIPVRQQLEKIPSSGIFALVLREQEKSGRLFRVIRKGCLLVSSLRVN
jgi:hypothetical protein